MRKSIISLAGLSLAALSLAACGITKEEPVEQPTIAVEQAEEATEAVAAPGIEDSSDGGSDASEASGQGVYQGETIDGATVTVAVPGEAPEDLKSFAESTGTEGVGYLVAEIDNTENESEVMLFEITVVDSSGKSYTYQDVSTGTYDWTSSDYETQSDLWEKYPYSVAPSAKSTIPLVGPEVPEDVKSVVIDGAKINRVGDL